MKKWIALFMVIVTTLSMTACESNLTAYELYMKACNSFNDADSIRMGIDMVMTMDLAGESITVNMNGTADEVIRSQTDVDMKMVLNSDTMGQSQSIVMYYKDGMAYMDIAGQKVKSVMPLEESTMISMSPMTFTKEAIKLESMTDVADGKEIAFTLDSTLIEDVIAEQVGDMTSTLGAGAEVTFGDVQVKTVISSKRELKSVAMFIPMNMSVMGYEVSATMDMTMDILQIGGVTVDFPADLDSYVEDPSLF